MIKVKVSETPSVRLGVQNNKNVRVGTATTVTMIDSKMMVVGDGLKLDGNVLSVDVDPDATEGGSKPIASGAVWNRTQRLTNTELEAILN